MNTYTALLRGINVGGKNILKMDALRESLAQHGFCDLSTYVQSGNIVFRSEAGESELAAQIRACIIQDFGMELSVLVFSSAAFAKMLENNPFSERSEADSRFVHLSFLSAPSHLPEPAVLAQKKQEGEEIQISDRVVYLYCPQGYGQTKLSNTWLESVLKVKASTRNWRTCLALLNMMQDTEALK